jgi:hypothetical protein
MIAMKGLENCSWRCYNDEMVVDEAAVLLDPRVAQAGQLFEEYWFSMSVAVGWLQ